MFLQSYSQGRFLVNLFHFFYPVVLFFSFLFLRLVLIDTTFDYRKILEVLYIHYTNLNQSF